ncbi:hypothetical protein [Oricola nitratireducens]|uniref:hypothetical protein n=1 Tax=Oricola nitratireducens TaxID=2775868 RepID=UPI0018663944|nr:hypothetical protein [Oricola nitratireducens]
MDEKQFERDSICYQQNFEQARNLNNQMNNLPTISMTLTGGLWFAAGVTEVLDDQIRFWLLILSGYCNILLIFSLFRIRDVFESYLERIKAFNPESFASGRPGNPKIGWLGKYSTITMYSYLMLFAAGASFIFAMLKYWPFAGLPKGAGFFIVALSIILLRILSGEDKHEERGS